MSEIFDTGNVDQLLTGLRQARKAIASGQLVVLPTDTVYGIAADAFSPRAVSDLLAAKGRDRTSPPPVLISKTATVHALAVDIPEEILTVTEAFWPGPLTVVLNARKGLAWDLGDTDDTVALRIPNHSVALNLIEETGPLAVSSANLHGIPPATTIERAQALLGEHVDIYLDAGELVETEISTIIDASLFAETGQIRILRNGAITLEQLTEILTAEKIAQ